VHGKCGGIHNTRTRALRGEGSRSDQGACQELFDRLHDYGAKEDVRGLRKEKARDLGKGEARLKLD
jgi:hypothetical protein